MDKSKLSKPGTRVDYDMFKHDQGRPKVSRKVESKCCCACGCPKGKCKCGDPMCMKDHTGDPLSPHNPCGGGKMY